MLFSLSTFLRCFRCVSRELQDPRKPSGHSWCPRGSEACKKDWRPTAFSVTLVRKVLVCSDFMFKTRALHGGLEGRHQMPHRRRRLEQSRSTALCGHGRCRHSQSHQARRRLAEREKPKTQEEALAEAAEVTKLLQAMQGTREERRAGRAGRAGFAVSAHIWYHSVHPTSFPQSAALRCCSCLT